MKSPFRTAGRVAMGAGVAITTLAGILFAAAMVAILAPDPTFPPAPPPTPQEMAAFAASFEQPYPSESRRFVMRDGDTLSSQRFPAGSPTTIVFVHGVLTSSFRHNRDSGRLREATGATVVAIDLRGHGASDGVPGDTRYIGQYEDDLADVVRRIRADHPGGKVILSGHSMGGGIVLRYAMRHDVPEVDGYLLFAPHLGSQSPTTPTRATEAGARFMRLHVPRLIGLSLVNAVGIRGFNGLNVLFFNLPPELPLRSYTFRAMAGVAPDDYRQALNEVHPPLLVLAGSADEAFRAEHYPEVVRANSDGEAIVVANATHDGVVSDARALAATAEWLKRVVPSTK